MGQLRRTIKISVTTDGDKLELYTRWNLSIISLIYFFNAVCLVRVLLCSLMYDVSTRGASCKSLILMMASKVCLCYSEIWCDCFRLHLKRDGTCAETRFRLSAKWTSPFKSAGAWVQSTTGSRGVRISSSNTRYTMFRGSVKGTGYPLHLPVSPSLPLLWVTMCHHISTAVYNLIFFILDNQTY
jgi:hypothetical protein